MAYINEETEENLFCDHNPFPGKKTQTILKIMSVVDSGEGGGLEIWSSIEPHELIYKIFSIKNN